MNKINKFIEKYHYVILFVIFGVFLFSRLLFLDKRPYGVNVDEIAGALDAKYICDYGMDRHSDHMPVYFKNYGGGMSALYVYMLAILFKNFPFSVFTIRIPAVICGFLCCIYSYKLACLLFRDERIALLAPILVTIMPFYMASERWGLDCNLFLSLVTVAMYYFIRAIISNKGKDYAIAGVWLGVTLYTYAISYIVLILFLLVIFIYLFIHKKINIKKWFIMAVPLFMLALPLMLFQAVNIGIIPEFTFLGSDFHRLSFYRAAELSLSNFINNIPFLGILLLGGDGLLYNAFDKIWFGTVYIYMVPFIIIGIVYAIIDVIKYKGSTGNDSVNDNMIMGLSCLLVFLLVSVIIILLVSAPSINKANQIYMPFMIFAIYGLKRLAEKNMIVTPIFIALCLVSFLLYSKFYFMDQKKEYGYLELFYPTISMDIIKYAEQNYDPGNSRTIYYEQQYEDAGAEIMFLHEMGNIPPEDFSEERTDFGKYQLHFTNDFNENEDAIYILGVNWNHIAGYLQSIGFNVDNSFENYSILFR